MKPLVIYHKNCMDGAGAALAAWLRFGDDAEYRAASYGDPAPTDEEIRGRDVYVLDFSYPRVELMRMAEVAAEGQHIFRLYVFDHHKSAEADLAGLPFCVFDMERSGAALAWRHFHGRGRYPDLICYIQDRDLWQWRLSHSKEISAALAASGALQDFRKLIPIYGNWHTKMDHANETRLQLVREGEIILKIERQMVERIAATAEEIEIRWSRDSPTQGGSVFVARALAACSAVLQSEVGEALAIESARRGRDAIGVAYYRDGEAGRWRVSLRSRDLGIDYERAQHPRGLEAPDVSAIAKAYGGGGHARAAGFSCDRLPWVIE